MGEMTQRARDHDDPDPARAREKQFRRLAEAMPQIVWSARPDGSCSYFNHRWSDYTGMSLTESQGFGWHAALYPDDVPNWLRRWQEALRTGQAFEIEYRLLHAEDGQYRWQLAKLQPIPDDHGGIRRWFGCCTDIDDQKRARDVLRQNRERVAEKNLELQRANQTLKAQIAERERVEEALQKQARILASILDNMGDAVIVADPNEQFLIFNPAAERMFGSGPTDTTSENWSKQYGLFLSDGTTVFPGDQMPLSRSIRGEEVDDVEMVVKHDKAPGGLWARVSGRPLKDGSGGSLGGVIVCRDITESKKEDAFREGQGRILEMIAANRPLSEVLANLMLLIEAQHEGMFCSVLLLSEDGGHVRHGAAPSLPEHYIRAVDGAPIGPKNGSCGTAMYLGKQVIVTDIFADPLWEDYRELAAASGLRACWSTPILSASGRVLGSFAMYYQQPRVPTGDEAKLTDVATHIAGLAIEHQRSTEELRASEERFAKAFNSNPNPMTLATLAEGRIIEVNESFVELSGYMRPELVGTTSPALIWKMPLARDELVQQVKDRGVVRNLEAKLRTKSGVSRVLLLSSLIVEIGGQKCLLTVGNDITERRRAEDQLRLLQAITMEVAVAPDLSTALEVVLRLVCETTGWVLGQAWVPSEDETVLECNPAWFGADEGLKAFRVGSENTRLMKGIGLPGRVWSSKQPVWIRDVTVDSNFPRAVLAREYGLKAALAIPILSDEKVIAVIEFFLTEPHDEDERLVKVITSVAAQLDLAIERKLAEEQLRRTRAELAHVSRVTTMGELAASIAHEVNQPLGAIVGNADICLQWLKSDQPPLDLLREALTDIASDGRRASEVISRIRSLVKGTSPQKSSLDVNEVVGQVVSLIAHEAQRRQVSLGTELQELPTVLGDRVQLQQVLLNLAMNGIDAMQGINDRKHQLTLSTARNESGILVSVKDDGVGINPEDADRVFRAFHTTKASGMGMGLAISRSIVEAHGGRLWAEANRDCGATFRFTLPAEQSA
jgi:PAS domain S-box-containing protein